MGNDEEGDRNEHEDEDKASNKDNETKIPITPKNFEISTDTMSKTFTIKTKK
jgi:hypothetical protein